MREIAIFQFHQNVNIRHSNKLFEESAQMFFLFTAITMYEGTCITFSIFLTQRKMLY